MTFPSAHPALARALTARNYETATPVQAAVLDPAVLTRDLLVSAQTGSGKTVAFGLAMAATVLGTEERFDRASKPLALIIAPTRELAMQVRQELIWLYAETGARVAACVGGMDARAEARSLEHGVHIVVGTPGRLRDHIERGRLDLTQLRAVVLDEADEMLDLGFREDLEFILDATPAERQTMLFSATMPREIEALARRYQRDAARIATVRRDEQHADIEYLAMRVAPGDAEGGVTNILRFHEARAALVFCATREAVKRMHARLAERGFSAVALSGELTQGERTQALQAVRDARARVLVATDVAARGLDLPDLTLVIHADLPNDGETLLHRSGRTGRAGRKGLCVLIVPYNRRRKAEMLLASARVTVTWGRPPNADEIRARDAERFHADAIFTETPAEQELTDARALQATRSADEIALALLRMHRARLPSPEDLAEDRGPPPRREGAERGSQGFERRGYQAREPRPEREPSSDRGQRFPRPRRDAGREMVWYRLNIGRERNADPRWLVPLICKAGDISKAEIGAIKIHDRDTRFEIAADVAEQFDVAVRSNKNKEGQIARVGATAPADDEAAPPSAPQREHKRPDRRPDTRPDRNPDQRAERAPDRERSEPAKAPWRDRGQQPAAKKPHRKGQNKPYFGAKNGGASTQADHAPGARSGGGHTPAGGKPNSKYAHKKKHRGSAAGT